MSEPDFEWDEAINRENEEKHGVSFYEAQHAFLDENRIFAKDTTQFLKYLKAQCLPNSILDTTMTKTAGSVSAMYEIEFSWFAM